MSNDRLADRARLIEIIRKRSYGTGVVIKLASGRTSDFYFNMKPTMLDPEGAYLIGKLVSEAIAPREADMVGGLEMGAVPIATAVAAMSFAGGHPLPAFFVRKQTKEHGTQSLIEGLVKGETIRGKRVIILEDVTTTGGSSLKAIDAIKSRGWQRGARHHTGRPARGRRRIVCRSGRSLRSAADRRRLPLSVSVARRRCERRSPPVLRPSGPQSRV